MSRDNAAVLMPRAFNSSAKCSPGWIAVRAICLHPQFGDLDVDWLVRALGPLEADPPLVVDADAVLALGVTAQGLQPFCRAGPRGPAGSWGLQAGRAVSACRAKRRTP